MYSFPALKPRTDRPRVVCIGDSNTYGLLEARENAYPAVLERLWNAATPARPVEVLNLGFPGLNSSKMRQSFRDLMIALRPDLVIMLVGVNDIYTAPIPIADEAGVTARAQYALWRLSRVYRLLYMLVSRLRSGNGETEQKQIDIQHKLMDNPHHGEVRVGDSQFDLASTNFADPAQLGNWSVALEGRNIFNKHYVLAGLQLASPVRPTVTGYPGDPRIIDIRLSADF